jgi:hypothetical protein
VMSHLAGPVMARPRTPRISTFLCRAKISFSGLFWCYFTSKGEANLPPLCALADRSRAVQNAEPLAGHNYSLGGAGLVILVLLLVGAHPHIRPPSPVTFCIREIVCETIWTLKT